MELTRRDAVAALAAAGAGSLAGCTADDGGGRSGRGESPLGGERVATLAAAAVVLYPAEVTGHEPFVRAYVDGRIAGGESRREAIARAVDDLDAAAREWRGDDFAALPPAERDGLLRELGVDAADSDPDGTVPERVRRHVVEELLYALYASPTGGRLVGIENPVGYPGGTESYRRPTTGDDGG